MFPHAKWEEEQYGDGEFPPGQLCRSPQLFAVAVLPGSFDTATGFGDEQAAVNGGPKPSAS